MKKKEVVKDHLLEPLQSGKFSNLSMLQECLALIQDMCALFTWPNSSRMTRQGLFMTSHTVYDITRTDLQPVLGALTLLFDLL